MIIRYLDPWGFWNLQKIKGPGSRPKIDESSLHKSPKVNPKPKKPRCLEVGKGICRDAPA